METGTLVTLALYFVLMLGIGLYAWRRSTADSAGYLLAGRSLSPAVAALSAGASDMPSDSFKCLYDPVLNALVQRDYDVFYAIAGESIAHHSQNEHLQEMRRRAFGRQRPDESGPTCQHATADGRSGTKHTL